MVVMGEKVWLGVISMCVMRGCVMRGYDRHLCDDLVHRVLVDPWWDRDWAIA